MSKLSLQDQLKALGLAKERQAPPKQVQTRPERSTPVKPAHRAQVPDKKGPDKKGPDKKMPGESRPTSNRAAAVKPKVNPLSTDFSLEDAYRMREQQTRQQAEAARQKKRQLDLERKRLNDSIRDIVMPHRLNDDAAELTRNFLYKGRIRKVRVNPDQLKCLNEGSAGLVYLSGSYHILPAQLVSAVRELSPDHVPDLSGGGEHGPEDEEFPVPDDLIW